MLLSFQLLHYRKVKFTHAKIIYNKIMMKDVTILIKKKLSPLNYFIVIKSIIPCILEVSLHICHYSGIRSNYLSRDKTIVDMQNPINPSQILTKRAIAYISAIACFFINRYVRRPRTDTKEQKIWIISY